MSIAIEVGSRWGMRGHRGGILKLVIDPPVCLWSASQCLFPRVCCLWYQSRETIEDHLLSPDGQSRGHLFWICLWLVLDTFLKINYLGCLFVHLLTFSGVQFSVVYFSHLLKLCFVAIYLRLCTYIQYILMCCILFAFLKTFTPQRQELTLNSNI